jgi:hypothetical protein
MVDEVRMFPRWFYKQGEEPRLCTSEEEATALGEGWSDEGPAAPPGREMPHGVADSEPDEDESPAGESPRRRR